MAWARLELGVCAVGGWFQDGHRNEWIPLGFIMDHVSATVFVVDNDASTRSALERLLGSVQLEVRLFAAPQEFLAAKQPNVPGCLVLDVRLPGMSGLTFQSELAKMNVDLPLIFVTRHGDVRTSVRAMKAGAFDFLTKPFRDQDMLDAIQAAIERNRERRRDSALVFGLQERYATLTERERQTMRLIVTGQSTKQIAAKLDLSDITVKAHRAQVMRKMHASSMAELVRMADWMARACPNVVGDPLQSRSASTLEFPSFAQAADTYAHTTGLERPAGIHLALANP